MNSTNVTIRTTVLPRDVDKIIQLHRTLYTTEYGYGKGFEDHVISGLQEFYAQYDEQRDRIWICECGNEFAGSLVLMHRTLETAQLRFFVIERNYRRKGLGSKLMRLVLDFLKEAGYTHAYLWTTSELMEAASLYKKFGFRLKQEKPSNAFGKNVIEQRYDLHLGDGHRLESF